MLSRTISQESLPSVRRDKTPAAPAKALPAGVSKRLQMAACGKPEETFVHESALSVERNTLKVGAANMLPLRFVAIGNLSLSQPRSSLGLLEKPHRTKKSKTIPTSTPRAGKLILLVIVSPIVHISVSMFS